MQNYGIYIHIPFCKARCSYCAFCSCTDFSLQEQYFAKLTEEMQHYANKKVVVSSVFFGGGTPSSVDGKYLQKIFNCLKDNFVLADNCEITVECNPESASQQLLALLKSNGVNRLSFGLQSANDSTLKTIGRLHNYRQFVGAVEQAAQCGFSNISCDLILGLPENATDFYNSVRQVCLLPINHVSVYALELHKGTPLHTKLKGNSLFDDDTLADMYDGACDILAQNGFTRYETSNFARGGKRCLHNLNYWQEGRYFAFGASASGFVENVRFSNPATVQDYLSTAVQNLHDDCQSLTLGDQANEFVMLGMRLDEGVNLQQFVELYGCDFFEFFFNAQKLLDQGLLAVVGGNVLVPAQKQYVVNSILCELLNL